MTDSPTVRRRQLSIQLIRLREQSGMTVEEVGKRLEWSRGRLTHMEQNKWTRPDLGNIRALLDLYGVTDAAEREAILTLARQSREKGWWADYKDVFRGSYPGFEAGAAYISTYEALYIPGLLQTADYAREIFRAGQVVPDSLIERRVLARLARQEVLSRREPPEFWAVIDEAALRRPVGGPEVMAAQLRHIIEMASRPRITVQVLPYSVGAHAAMGGPFVVLDFATPDDPSLVYIETATDALYLEKAEELHRYRLIWSRALTSALDPEASLRYLATLVDQLS